MRRVRVIRDELLYRHGVYPHGEELNVPFADAQHLAKEGSVEILSLDFDPKSKREDLLAIAERFGVEGLTTHSTKPEIVHALELYQRRDARAVEREASAAEGDAEHSALPPEPSPPREE